LQSPVKKQTSSRPGSTTISDYIKNNSSAKKMHANAV